MPRKRTVTIRLYATDEQIAMLLDEWLNQNDPTVQVTPRGAQRSTGRMRLTYVKEG